MPTKGQYTAAACILFDRPATLDEVADALSDYEIVGRADEAEDWAVTGPAVVLAYRPEVNGLVAVDTVEHRWPDEMGHPEDDPKLFAAWATGQFGPLTFPGSLGRAAAHCWGWPDGKQAPGRHMAFVRLRTSYVLGQGDDAPLFPADYAPTGELRFLLGAAAAVLRLPGAFCFFNPGGEVLRDIDTVADDLAYADANKLPPLELVSNIRVFPVTDDWLVMDTVGNQQYDRPGLPAPFPDAEACFKKGTAEPAEVDAFLRNVTLYLLDNGPVFKDGDRIDGPGGVAWQAQVRAAGVMNPPRPTVRFFPADAADVPPVLRADMGAAAE